MGIFVLHIGLVTYNRNRKSVFRRTIDMRNVLAFLLSLAFFLAPAAAADDLPVVTLDEALASAEANSIGLQQARIKLDQTVRNQDAVMTTFMPDLALTAGLSTGAVFPGHVLGEAAVGSTMFTGLNVSAGVAASFTFDGTMITDGAGRRIAKEGATLDYASAHRDMESSIVDAYWSIAAGDASEQSARLSLENAMVSYDSAKEMYEAGLADELTLRDAELMIQQAEIQVQTLSDANALTKSAFMNATGLKDDFTTEPMPGTVMLDLPSPEELFDEYAEGSLDIRTARNDLLNAQNGLDTANVASFVPVLAVNVNYNYAGSTGAGGVWDYSHQTHALTGGVTLTLPISSMIPGSEADMLRKDAGDAVSLASLALQSAQDTLLEGIRQSVMTIEQSQKTIAMETARLETAKRSYELAQESFSAGLITASDLNTRRNSLLSAELSLLSAQLDQLVASYDLSYMLGISIESLQTQYMTIGEEK